MTYEETISKLSECNEDTERGKALLTIPKITRVPESRREKLIKRIRNTVDTHDIGAEVVDALQDVSQLPGMIEDYRWAKILNGGLEVRAAWDVPDEIVPEKVEAELERAIRKAFAKFQQKEALREAYSLQLASLLDRAKSLEAAGEIDSALDIIYDSFDELFRRGQFPLCDSVLAETSPEKYSSDILLAILTATAPAKSKLGMRRKLFRSIKRLLKSRKDYERGLLDGLG